jgi:hypothetical protein
MGISVWQLAIVAGLVLIILIVARMKAVRRFGRNKKKDP